MNTQNRNHLDPVISSVFPMFYNIYRIDSIYYFENVSFIISRLGNK